MYRTGIIGCGQIFSRHLEAINSNEDFELIAICDTDADRLKKLTHNHHIPAYEEYEEMLRVENLNFIVIATPNGSHVTQALYALEKGCDVLIEKPVSLNPADIAIIEATATKHGRKAYGVLQVRLNEAVQVVKELLDSGTLGIIRGISLVQRWQRPLEYFTGWRAIPSMGGGILHECGIHYIDILCYLLGPATVMASEVYKIKHKDVEIEDTVYALLDYENFGGTLEVTVAAEPQNVECSVSMLTDKGYIKIGGSALDKIEEARFLDEATQTIFNRRAENMHISKKPNEYLSNYKGSCPNHVALYAQLEKFEISGCHGALALIDEIYEVARLDYKKTGKNNGS